MECLFDSTTVWFLVALKLQTANQSSSRRYFTRNLLILRHPAGLADIQPTTGPIEHLFRDLMSKHGSADEKNGGAAKSSSGVTASLAHEINNPLLTLSNLLFLVAGETNLSEAGRNYLALAQEEVRRLAQITRESLNQGHSGPRQETDICQLLSGVVNFYKPRFDSSGIAVEGHYSCEASIPVYAAQLRQLFSNLLLNSMEATSKGGKVRVHVGRGREWWGKERTGIRITVADNGSGIPDGLLARIFQRSFTMKIGGHGMGLALVRDVVRKHGGQLRVRSNTKSGRHGTVFSVFLPA